MIWTFFLSWIVDHTLRGRQGNKGWLVKNLTSNKKQRPKENKIRRETRREMRPLEGCMHHLPNWSTQVSEQSLTGLVWAHNLLFFSFLFFFFPNLFWKITNAQNSWTYITMKVHICFTQICHLLPLCHLCWLSPCHHPLWPPPEPFGSALQASWLIIHNISILKSSGLILCRLSHNLDLYGYFLKLLPPNSRASVF